MKSRFWLFLLVMFISGLALEWHLTSNAYAGNEQTQHADRKKKKKKKKKKTKTRNDSKNTKKSTAGMSDAEKAKVEAKEKKAKAKRDKKHEKSVSKVQKKRDKKNKAIAKEREKTHSKYTKCDSADVVRTSHDSLILKKYITIYRSMGGICYIIHLQKMADIKKTGDGLYSVRMKQSDDPRAPADWQTYLFCPIGKPDGTVALTSPEGDTVQVCSYFTEKKSGMMQYYQKGKGLVHEEKYVDDRRPGEGKKEDE
ncbi:MAG: hypothetical protein ACRCYO_15300 [Bacteroidia bacterium]